MHTSTMEPLLPPAGGKFESAAIALHREAAALATTAHPITRAALAKLVRVVNSYYSNLIEGIRTTPAEIQAAMRADYSYNPERAAIQRLAVAHIRVEDTISAELTANPDAEVTTPEFLRRLHADLYANVPETARIVRSAVGRESIVIPGELRTQDVSVGNHLAPPFADLPALLDRFHQAYRPGGQSEVRRVIAFAASHHRLAWIHPFLDGNGRVSRLMTTMYARRIALDGGGLWSVARGFARERSEYYSALAAADQPRHSDADGRGALSLSALEAWCEFAVRVSLDQIVYMRSLLAPETLGDRLRAYSAYQATLGSNAAEAWRSESGDLLADLVMRGSLPRSEAMKFLPGKERTSRSALSTLLRNGILESDSHRSSVRLAFPAEAALILFPKLMTPDGD